jgi:hypothetical protein
VTLAWDPSTDPTVTGYNVYYGEASGTYTNPVNAGNATNVTISGLVQGTTYYFAATTYASSDMEMESPFSSEVSYQVPLDVPIVKPPTLDPISDLTTNENAGLQTVSLSGITSGATNENQVLHVTAVSGNTGLIPNPTVNYTSANTTGTLTFTPVTNANGTAIITVTVNDGGTINSNVTQFFTVTVNAVNQRPTMNAIGNLVINENARLQTVSLSGITSGAANENQVLTVTASSSNTGLIPNPTVNYTSANTTGTLTFTPVVNKTGAATVTVTVNDGGTSNNIVTRTFTVTVNAVNQLPTLDPLNSLIIYEDAKVQKVDLSGITAGAANEKQKIKVTAASDNLGLIRSAKISYTSPHTTGRLTFAPVVNMTGTAAITVTVNNGGASNNIVTQTFTVTVIAPPLPTFDAINDITVSENAALQAITVTGISGVATNEKPKLKLTVKSSNPSLVHKPSVKYHNPDTTATLSFKPAPKKTGTTIITVTLKDQARKINNTFTRTFMITVLSNNVATPAVASRTVTNSTNSAPADLTGKLVKKTGTTINNAFTGTSMITVLSNNVATPAAASQTVTDSTNSAPADLTGELVPVTLESLGYANGQYALTVAGAPGYGPAVSGGTCVIEASTDLVNWVPVATNTVPFTFVDTNASQFTRRFYRTVSIP